MYWNKDAVIGAVNACGLIETWDVLKLAIFAVIFFAFVINRNMRCIEIPQDGLVNDGVIGLIETWDVLKFIFSSTLQRGATD